MQKILETARIYLREMVQDDFQDLGAILQDKETMYAYEHAFSDSEVQDWLDRQRRRYQQDGFGLWGMIEKTTGLFIGQAGLTMQNTGNKEEVEIGYLLNRRYWHRGYACEAAAACREYAFNVLGCDKVVSIIRDNNISSRRVAEKTGMKKERTLVKHYYNMDMPHCVYVVYRQK